MSFRKFYLDYLKKNFSILNEKNRNLFESKIYEVSGKIENKYKKIFYEKVGELHFITKTENCEKNIIHLLNSISSKGWDSLVYGNFKTKRANIIVASLCEDSNISKCEFKCRNRKCNSDQCYFYNEQTRRADEGFTTFVVCKKCGTRYKFG